MAVLREPVDDPQLVAAANVFVDDIIETAKVEAARRTPAVSPLLPSGRERRKLLRDSGVTIRLTQSAGPPGWYALNVCGVKTTKRTNVCVKNLKRKSNTSFCFLRNPITLDCVRVQVKSSNYNEVIDLDIRHSPKTRELSRLSVNPSPTMLLLYKCTFCLDTIYFQAPFFFFFFFFVKELKVTNNIVLVCR